MCLPKQCLSLDNDVSCDSSLSSFVYDSASDTLDLGKLIEGIINQP